MKNPQLYLYNTYKAFCFLESAFMINMWEEIIKITSTLNNMFKRQINVAYHFWNDH